MSFRLSTFRSAFDPHPRGCSSSYPALVKALTNFRVLDRLPWWCGDCKAGGDFEEGPACPECGAERSADKRGVPAWSPATYPEGVRRSKGAVTHVSCLVLDYDNGTTMDAASEVWRQWPHIVHTSWSHTEEHHKFRLVLPMARPVPVKFWPRVWAWAEKHSGCEIDTACKDPSRLYFVPAIRSADWPHEAREVDEGGTHLLDTAFEKLPLTKEEREAKEREVRRKSRCAALRKRPDSRPWVARRAAQRLLNEDPGAREQAAAHLGARLMGGKAKGAKCPGCGRASVWWLIEPHSMAQAQCDHRNSCGWHGWLDQLLDQSGVAA